jgi:DNA-binding transcriptional MerR regulator
MNTRDAENGFTLDALSALVDLPKRTVRYYIQIGLVDRPEGETRSARYGPRHVEQLVAIRRWTLAGVSLERIGRMLAGDPASLVEPGNEPGNVAVCSHLTVAEGVELVLDPSRAGLSPEAVRRLFSGVMALYQGLPKKEKQ